jgi:hypothetical protein
VEVRAHAAWVVTVSDGKLRRVEAFSSWDAADAAAGIAAGGGSRCANRHDSSPRR